MSPATDLGDAEGGGSHRPRADGRGERFARRDRDRRAERRPPDDADRHY